MLNKYIVLFSFLFSISLSQGQTADFTASPTTICAGGTINFVNLSVGATTYSWTFVDGGAGQNSTAFNPSITYMNPGVYAVILTVANGGNNDTEVKSAFITVLSAATAVLTSGAGTNNQMVCLGQPLTNITYAITGATGVSFSGLPAGCSGSFVASPNGGTATISGTPSSLGTFPYTITTTGGNCAPIVVNGTITVGGNATLTLASGNANPTLCAGNLMSNITFTIGGSATGAVAAGLPPGVTGSFFGSTLTISGTPSVAGTFNYTVSTTGGPCPPVVFNGVIDVQTLPTLTLTSAAGTNNQTLCQTTALTTITYDVTGATGAIITGLPAGVTGVFTSSPATVTISGAPSASGTFNYTVTTTGTSCPAAVATGTIVVGADATITLTSGSSSQTDCINLPMTNVVYTIGGSGTGATVIGLPLGVTGNLVGNTLTISGTPTQTGSYGYTITTSGGPCPPVNFFGTLNVDPDIQLATPIGSDNQTLCENDPLSNIVYNLGPSITGATITGLPVGVTGTFNPGIFIITGSPTTAGIYNYTITTSGGSCGPATASGTITVDMQPILTLDVAGTDNQTVCISDSIVDITYTVGGSATGASVSGLPSGVNGVFNAGVFTISGSTIETGTFIFDIVTSGSSCGQANLSGSLTIQPAPQLQLITPFGSDDQQLCINEDLDSIIYVFSGSALGANVINLPTGMNWTIQNDSIIITGSNATPGIFNYSVFTAGGVCIADTSYGNITIGDSVGLNLTSPLGTDVQTLCNGSLMDTIVYTIFGAADTAIVTGLPLGVTSTFVGNTLTITGNPTTTGTSNFTVTASGGFCPNVILFGQISVISPQIDLVSAAATDTQGWCINSQIDTIIYVFAGGVTGATVLNLPTGINTAIQNDSILIFGTATSAGSYSFIVHTTGGACAADSAYGLLVIDDSSGVILASAVGTNAQIICENQSIVTIVYTLIGTADTAFVTGLPAGVTSVFSGDSLIINGIPAFVGITTYSVISSGGYCPNDTITGTIEVVSPQIALITAPYTNDQTVQLNTAIAPITYTIGGPVTVSDLPPGVTATVLPGSPSTVTLTGIPSDTGTFYYVLQIDGFCGNSLLVGKIRVVSNVTAYDTSKIFIPNLFSPNNDGFNDTFVIPQLDQYTGTSLTIINREGRVVYKDTDYKNTWDGTMDGNGVDKLPEATYYYLVVINNDLTNKLTGPITILRNEK